MEATQANYPMHPGTGTAAARAIAKAFAECPCEATKWISSPSKRKAWQN